MLYALKKDAAGQGDAYGVAASLTRIWGVLSFFVLVGSWLWNKKLTPKRVVLALAVPASLLLLFTFYAYSLGNFFAYFAVNSGFLQIPCSSSPQAPFFLRGAALLLASGTSCSSSFMASLSSSFMKSVSESSFSTRSLCFSRCCLFSTKTSAVFATYCTVRHSSSASTRLSQKSESISLSLSHYSAWRPIFTAWQSYQLTCCHLTRFSVYRKHSEPRDQRRPNSG